DRLALRCYPQAGPPVLTGPRLSRRGGLAAPAAAEAAPASMSQRRQGSEQPSGWPAHTGTTPEQAGDNRLASRQCGTPPTLLLRRSVPTPGQTPTEANGPEGATRQRRASQQFRGAA